MCGRYNLRTSAQAVAQHFGTRPFPEFENRYNIAPTENILIISDAAVDLGPVTGPVAAGEETVAVDPALAFETSGEDLSSADPSLRRPAWARWGLLPTWLKSLKGWAPRINARSETVASNGVFRSAFAARRCLIPASGFYEWQAIDPKHKQPFHIQPRELPFLSLAGIWERWFDGQREILSCAVLTCSPNQTMNAIHDRMPVILDRADWDRWLDPSLKGAALADLLVPCPDDWLDVQPIATTINNARNKTPEALNPL